MALTESDKEWFESKLNAAMVTAINAHADSCAVKNEVFGNGRPGLKLDVHDLKQDIDNLKRCKAGMRQFISTVGAGVLTGVITAGILVFVGLKTLPKTPPDTETASHGQRP